MPELVHKTCSLRPQLRYDGGQSPQICHARNSNTQPMYRFHQQTRLRPLGDIALLMAEVIGRGGEVVMSCDTPLVRQDYGAESCWEPSY